MGEVKWEEIQGEDKISCNMEIQFIVINNWTIRNCLKSTKIKYFNLTPK